MPFSLTFSNQAEKFLKKVDGELSQRIVGKIKLLQNEPVPHNAVKIVGEERTFRIRVGDYRVIYELYWKDNAILIVKIDKREKVYD